MIPVGKAIPVVRVTKVDRVLGDYPPLLRHIADDLEHRWRFGDDAVEQLRGLASELDALVLAIVHRLT